MPEKKSNKNYPYIPCRLVDYDGDVTKKWYIRYYIYNTDRQALQKKDITSFNKGYPTTDKRRAAAKKIMRDIDSLLESGATTYDGKYREETKDDKLDIYSIKAVAAYRVALDKTKRSLEADTVRAKRLAIDHFEKFLKVESIEHIYFKSVEIEHVYLFSDYLTNTVGVSNKTHNNTKGYLSSLHNYFKKRYPNVIHVNPFEIVENKKVETGDRHAPYSDGQVKKIKKYLTDNGQDRLLVFIQFVYFAFLRPKKELRLLKIKDLRAGSIFVRGANAKDDEGAHVRIPEELESLIVSNRFREYPENYYLFGGSGLKTPEDAESVVRWEGGQAFDASGKKVKTYAGFPGPSPTGINYFYKQHRKMLVDLGFSDDGEHDLYCYKHTGNIKLWLACGDLHLIKEQNRHSTLEQTEKYLRKLGMFIDATRINKFPKF